MTLNYTTYSTDVASECDQFTWIDGITYSQSNSTAQHILTNAQGCDSVVTLDLTINYSSIGTDVQTACEEYTWIDGNTYFESNNTAQHTLTNESGCDSTVSLDLTINYSNEGVDLVVACDSFLWIDGNTYFESTNYGENEGGILNLPGQNNDPAPSFVLTNQNGCDSTVYLDLTINNSTSGTDVITACDSYTWIDGNTYSQSNNSAQHTLTNAEGCDSIVTLDLTINYTTYATDVQIECDSYIWINGTNLYFIQQF